MPVVHQVCILVLLEDRPKTGGGTQARFAYLGALNSCGTIVELIEIKTAEISFPQTDFRMEMGD